MECFIISSLVIFFGVYFIFFGFKVKRERIENPKTFTPKKWYSGQGERYCDWAEGNSAKYADEIESETLDWSLAIGIPLIVGGVITIITSCPVAGVIIIGGGIPTIMIIVGMVKFLLEG